MRGLFSLVFLFVLFGCSTTGNAPGLDDYAWERWINSPEIKLKTSRRTVTDASVIRFELKMPPDIPWDALDLIGVEFSDKRYSFFPAPKSPENSGEYWALVPIPYLLDTGRKNLNVVIGTPEKNRKLAVSIRVKRAKYRSEKLRVDPSKVEFTDEDVERIVKEVKLVKDVYSTVVRERFWDEFKFPIRSRVTSPFGTKRMFNRELKSFHNGIDFRAATGTPIRAPASGKVVLVKDLFFTGNTVILDHGFGVMTLYAHLSKVSVSEGEEITPSTILGLAGSTGRSTAPHLHWAVVMQGTKVNPFRFLEAVKK